MKHVLLLLFMLLSLCEYARENLMALVKSKGLSKYHIINDLHGVCQISVNSLSNSCQLLSTVVNPLSNSCQLLSTVVNPLSNSCQLLSTVDNPLSNSCQIFMAIKSICQISVNWISWFIRPYNINLCPKKQWCCNSNVQKQEYCAACWNKQLYHAFLQGCHYKWFW